MKKVLGLLVLAVLGLAIGAASAQGIRYDNNVMAVPANTVAGRAAPLYSSPYARVNVCGYPAVGTPCTNTVVVYSDRALTVPMTQPIVADTRGGFGFWATPGTYSYTVSSPAGVLLATNAVSLGNGGGIVSLTTVGTSGAATNIGGVLNVPQYAPGGVVQPSYVLRGPSPGASPAPVTYGPITQDDILPGFAITGFACSSCGSYEIGQTVASPTTFTASYSSSASSASISDGTHNTTLTTPFTSGSLAYSYTSTVQATTTFTLTAAAAVTRTATAAIGWYPRTFAGIGTAGATSATASGSSAVLPGSRGTLSTAGLNNQSSYGPFSPTNQKVYVLMIGCSHTFTSAGFAFPMLSATSFSFTNQYGAAVSMCLYESTNLLSAPLTLTLAS